MLPAGFYTPLIDTDLNELATLAHNTGLAGLAIHDPYNRGVLGLSQMNDLLTTE